MTACEQVNAQLEVPCERCHGKGGWHSDGWRRCGQCNGAGFVPTETGAAILALLRHNFKPLLEDVEAERAG